MNTSTKAFTPNSGKACLSQLQFSIEIIHFMRSLLKPASSSLLYIGETDNYVQNKRLQIFKCDVKYDIATVMDKNILQHWIDTLSINNTHLASPIWILYINELISNGHIMHMNKTHTFSDESIQNLFEELKYWQSSTDGTNYTFAVDFFHSETMIQNLREQIRQFNQKHLGLMCFMPNHIHELLRFERAQKFLSDILVNEISNQADYVMVAYKHFGFSNP